MVQFQEVFEAIGQELAVHGFIIFCSLRLMIFQHLDNSLRSEL